VKRKESEDSAEDPKAEVLEGKRLSEEETLLTRSVGVLKMEVLTEYKFVGLNEVSKLLIKSSRKAVSTK
jgi:hypothetical protein